MVFQFQKKKKKSLKISINKTSIVFLKLEVSRPHSFYLPAPRALPFPVSSSANTLFTIKKLDPGEAILSFNVVK